MQTTLTPEKDPSIRADTLPQRLALFGAIFLFLSIPAGLVAGSAEAVLVEGVSVAETFEGAVVVGLGLALLAVPGVVVYGLLLETARRRNRLNRTTIVLASPALTVGWFLVAGPYAVLAGAGGVSTMVSLAVFSAVTLLAHKHRAF